MSMSLALDLGIILLLGVVIAYAVVLNRKLKALRAAKSEMETLLSDFQQATGQAEAGLQALREVAAGSGAALDAGIQRAGAMVEDLTFLVGRAESESDRLEAGISRGRTSDAARGRSRPAGVLPGGERSAAPSGSAKARPAPRAETAPIAGAEPATSRGSALVKALREMR